MDLAAVRLRVAADDFYLLPTTNSDEAAQMLARRLLALRDAHDASVSLRPRTVPDGTDDVSAAPDSSSITDSSVTDPELPGTQWHYTEAASIQAAEALTVDEHTPLWHWKIGETPDAVD